jgi:hypothetical protein
MPPSPTADNALPPKAAAVEPTPAIPVAAAPNIPPAETRPKLENNPAFPKTNAPTHDPESVPATYPPAAVDAIQAPDECNNGTAIIGNIIFPYIFL